MGKWSEVKCSCPNRVPINKAKPWDSEYECGHVDGVLYQCWPFYLILTGRRLQEIFKDDPIRLQDFEQFIRIGNYDNYRDEYLELNGEQRNLWQLEIEELQRVQRGEVYFPYKVQQLWDSYWREFFTDAWRQKDAESVESILSDGIALCEASKTSGNPIEISL